MCSGLHIKVFPVKTVLNTLEKHRLTHSALAALAVGEMQELIKRHPISPHPSWCYTLSCVYHVPCTVSGSLHALFNLNKNLCKVGIIPIHVSQTNYSSER